ncbi:hypothetical protein QBC35DRAFT_377081 [Podospora australis]|uniref:N-acetyltransferase domain-containing protein n=1 Tax=Podospora australis TaxID=1536484 RepID=A0AAN6WZI5_9PEZI|nr:hypothetical protein QBC35DRAFT_377081 [Podospora australis]
MMRRRHKKSRKGCLECKKRHIKVCYIVDSLQSCDETRPRCINCATVERDCQYPAPAPALAPVPTPAPGIFTERSASPLPVAGSAYAAGSISTSVSASASVSSLTLAPEPLLTSGHPSPSQVDVNPFPYAGEMQSNVDLVHMQLLHHYLTGNEQIYPFVYGGLKETIMQVALREPFLIHSVLAMAARHLSVARPEQKDYYRTLAIQLQTRALSIFNSFSLEYFDQSMERRIPAFLFSSVLGFHALCDMLSYRDSDYATSHARYVGYVHLHRGLLVVMDGHWEDLKTTELKILFDNVIPQWFELSCKGEECSDLIKLIESCGRFQGEDLNGAKRAIECLQWVLDAKPDYKSRVHVLCSFAVLIPRPLVRMIAEGAPEAMVILSYYYVALHFCRDVWLIGDSGKFLLTSLVNHLGPEWSSWLDKPLRMMREHDEETLSRETPPMALEFKIIRPSEVDAARIADIHVAAMYSNPLLHAQFPTPESLRALTSFLEADIAGAIRNAATGILVAQDPETGVIAGFIRWTSPSHPEDVKLESGDLQYLEGCRREFLDGYTSVAEAAKDRSVGDKPCYRISFVCTDPAYQGRGAGTLLTRKLLEMAEDDRLSVYLESTKVAVPMYEKLGFQAIDAFQMQIPRPGDTELSETYEEVCTIWHPSTLTSQR